MLETIRQYASARLGDDPEHDAVHRRHCAYYLDLVEENVPRLSTHREGQALATLDAELHNLRSALQWALGGAPDAALRLAGQVGQYWRVRASSDARHWLDAALQAAGEHAAAADRARARLYHAGISETLSGLALAVAVFDDDLESERRYAEQACEHARIAGDDALLGSRSSDSPPHPPTIAPCSWSAPLDC